MKLDDAIKFAVLMRCVTGQLKTWLQLNVAETQDYSRLREAIIQYDSATLKWNNAMMLGQEVNKDCPGRMEIDRVMEKGKGGKTGKGKGKENAKEKERANRRVASKGARERVSRKARTMVLEAKANKRALGSRKAAKVRESPHKLSESASFVANQAT